MGRKFNVNPAEDDDENDEQNADDGDEQNGEGN